MEPAPLEGEVGVVVADLRCAAASYSNRGFSTDARRCRRAATLLSQLSAPVPVVVAWTHEPSVKGRYLCLREGVYTLHDVDFYRDLQMGITGQWEATEVCSGNRHGCSVAKLQPAAWLPVHAILLPQGGEVEG